MPPVGWRSAYYFWRIDEIDNEGNTTTGDVWTFTTTSPPPPKGRTCFVAETGVWVDGTLVEISKVGTGQNICLTNNLGKIHEVQEHEGTFECHDILLQSGNRIGVAECHYFLTESGDWVAVQNLKMGTKLQTPKGSIAIVSVTKRPVPYTGRVYNLKAGGS